MLESYKPSGKTDVMLFPLAAAGIIVAICVSAAYQLLVNYIPFIYINFLLTMGASAGMYYVVREVCRIGKCRNLMAALGVAAAIGGAGVAGSHYFGYRYFVSDFVSEIQALSPQEQAEFMGEEDLTAEELANYQADEALIRSVITFKSYWEFRVESGWSIGRGGGLPITGFFVYLIWLIEAGILLSGPFKSALESVKIPFDESTDAWMELTELVTWPTSHEACNHVAAADSVEQLLKLPGRARLAAVTAKYCLASSPTPGEPAFLTITKHWEEKNKKGEDVSESEVLQTWVKLMPAQVEALQQAIHGGAAAPAPAGA